MFEPEVLIIDIDGVLTSGNFFYSENGKVMKAFGADDADALSLIKDFVPISFVSGDKRGFNISKKRIEDMGFELNFVSTIKRIQWIKDKFDSSKVIYIGDGIFDFLVMNEVGYSICPKDSDEITQKYANYITAKRGGDRAVSEAIKHIFKVFFKKISIEEIIKKKSENND